MFASKTRAVLWLLLCASCLLLQVHAQVPTNLVDINTGTANSTPQHFVELGGKLYFTAISPGGTRRQLYSYDPALAAGSQMVQVSNFNGSAPTTTTPNWVRVLGNKLVMVANGSANGNELWEYDPTNASFTEMATNGTNTTAPTNLLVHAGKLYYSGHNLERSAGGHGQQLYVYDPALPKAALTAPNPNPKRLTNLNTSFNASVFTTGCTPQNLVGLPGKLLFSAQLSFTTNNGGGIDQNDNRELVMLDTATEAITTFDLAQGSIALSFNGLGYQDQFDGNPLAFSALVGGTLYFSANATVGGSAAANWRGQVLMKFNPSTMAVPAVVKELNPDSGVTGAGTSSATYAAGDNILAMVAVGTKLYYVATDGGGTTGEELYVCDTANSDAVTVAANIAPGVTSGFNSFPDPSLTFVGNQLFFTANANGGQGYEPWHFDPATSIATQLGDLNTGGDSSAFGFLPFDGRVFFRAVGTGIGTELHVFDPGNNVTSLVADTFSGSSSGATNFNTATASQAPTVANFRNRLIFQAADGSVGNEPFVLASAVSITASIDRASEISGTPTTWTITRNGSLTNAATVNFAVGGTATYPADHSQSGAASFNATAGSVTMNAGVATKTFTTTPINDGVPEPDETITITLTSQTVNGVTTTLGTSASTIIGPERVPPVITYTPLTDSATASSRTLTNFATITDNIAVSTGAKAPRFYYKKTTDADAFVGNTAADNGWKYVTASNSSSPYSFIVDYSILNGGGVISGTVIQYFVVAQDDADNLTSNPAGAGASADPPVQNINSKPTAGLNSYLVLTTPVGTKTVCVSGCDYPSLTGNGGVFHAINNNTLSGNVTVNLTGDLTEDGTNALNQWAESGAGNYTVTIQPADATTKTISGAVANGMIRLNGADRVTFDGRFGGAGRFLTFRNSNTGNSTFTFINDASSNAIRYSIIEGASTSASNGTVFFSTTTGTTGNDNNTLDNCDIRDAASTPSNAVYSLGTTTSTATNNSGNTVSNCNIYNFYAATAIDTAGVRLEAGNTDWTITGNGFFQTASRAGVAASVRPIYINNTSGNSFVITDNNIGGSTASGGGSPWLTTGTPAYLFAGIQLNVGTTTPSSVQGNTIKNFIWNSSGNSSGLPGVWSGIYLQAGGANIGTTTANIIGSASGNDAVSVTTSGNGGTTFGIGSASGGTVAISNNIVGSMTTNGTATSVSASLTGIQVTGGTYTIANNAVGSISASNSLNAGNSSISGTGQQVNGILSSSGTSASITGNTVANLNNNYAGTNGSGQVRGIVTTNGANTITSNTVRNLSTTSQSAGTGASQSVHGIIQTSTTAGQTVSQNVVHSLSNTASTAAVGVAGIYYTGPTTGTNVVARNFVHGLAASSNSATSAINGLQLSNGAFTVQNNIVRMGFDSSGASTAGSSILRGLYDSGGDANHNIYHNSVYLGGTATSGAANTIAFESVGSTNARTFQNNIFANARTNGGGTGRHYAVSYGGTSANPTGLTSNNNIFFATGVGSVLGFYNNADRATMFAWRSATGQDGQSLLANPQFVDPAGPTPDLHLQATNPAEGTGVAIPSVTEDFDGQTRSGLTPTDIGADAGNFTVGDFSAPDISYALLTNGSAANRTLTNFATITDNVGVSGGLNAPRFYYKKAADAEAFVGNTAADNGWKFVTASNSSSPYSFTIDYSIINGGSVTSGDVIQYFVVAQDAANNLASNPAGATASGNPPMQNISGKPTAINSYTINPVLSGTKSVGAGGDYTTLTGPAGLFADINRSVVVGDLTVNVLGDLTEDGANGLNQWLEEGAGNYSVTIRPVDGTMKTISGNVANGMVRLDGADRVTIDGRFSGAGRFLTFRNSNASNPTFTLMNDASNNAIRYSIIEGASTSASNGTVFFSTTTGTNGNDDNTLDNCDLKDGASTPSNAVYSLGTTTTTATNNSGNTVSNCNIYNFYAATATDVAGVRLEGGSTYWTISGNSFYQTATRAAVSAAVRPIYINNSSGNNFVVTNNLIGGTAAAAGGTPWTTTGTSLSYFFTGIHLAVGTTTASSVQGNTIANMVWTSNGPVGFWNGIYLASGTANIGTTAANTVGSGTGTGSISLTTSSSGGTAFGITSGSNATVAITNNTVGSMTINASATSVAASLVGIQVSTGTNTVSNNLIGSLTTANSLNAATASNSGIGQAVSGIVGSSSVTTTISGNTVANLNNNYIGSNSSGQVRGIYATNGVNTITGNTVRNLSTSSTNVNIGFLASALGIGHVSSLSGQTVSQNVVHSLSNTTSGLIAVGLDGIYFASGASGTNLVERNLIHSLAVTASSSDSSSTTGIELGYGTMTVQNNMVRLGIDAAGANASNVSILRGIFDNNGGSGRDYSHNSVYLGGNQTGGAAQTFAFQSNGTNNTRSFRNNIFFNARTRTGGTQNKHYAIRDGGSGQSPIGLTSNGNILFVTGVGGNVGFYGGIDYVSISDWRNATGKDANSIFTDPKFIDPAAPTPNLHLQATNPAERNGLPLGVIDDFDGELRATLTPNDIGADAGDFTASTDIYAPSISYTPLSNSSPSNRLLTGFATITDNIGVSTGANVPRFYFKKATDADVFNVPNDSTGNGWKYVTASNASSPYSFTVDYSLLNGGSVSVGNIIQYFVVAQDDANNLGSLPTGATASANPPVQNVSVKPSSVSTYKIVVPLSGTKTVGTGGDYPTLTSGGGLFEAINDASLDGNLTVNIVSNLTESGGIALNQWVEVGAGGYTLTIQPASGSLKTISGAPGSGLIRLNGADRVTIDGRFGGTGRYLLFRNTNSTNPTMTLLNDASNNTIRSSIIEGGTTNNAANGVLLFSSGTTTGNDNNVITDNQIRDRSDTAGVPGNLIYSVGSSAAAANSGNTISNNEIFNFTDRGIGIVSDNSGNESWTISGNTIYQTASRTTSPVGINFNSTGTNTITANTIRDLTGNGSGGIAVITALNTTISRNRIYGLNGTASATNNIVGINYLGGSGASVTIVNNQITLIPSLITSQPVFGIFDAGTSGSTLNSYFNSVLIGGTSSGSTSSWAMLRYFQTSSAHTSRDNIYFNNRTGGSGNHYAAGNQTTAGSFSSNYNVLVGRGATLTNFFDSGTTAAGTPVPFAQWKTNTGGDANSQAGNPGGGFTTALFVNPSAGDLHIDVTANPSPVIADAGIPVAGVTTDFDNETRNAGAPDIGSDELGLPEIAVEQPAGSDLTDGDITPLSFGGSDVGTTVSKTFTIKNIGAAPLTGLGITINGSNPSEFVVTASPTAPLSGPSGSTTFTVTFTPAAAGSRSAALHIASNDADENPFDINLAGTGLNAPPVAVADSIVRLNNTKIAKVLKTVLLENDTDPDNDPRSLITVGAATPAGSTVAIAGTFVIYTAPAVNSGNGSFTYTLSDGPGGHTVTGTVTVAQVAPPTAGGPNSASSTTSGGNTVLTFLGVPGNTYRIQYTTNTVAPFTWNEFNPLAVYTAPANGVVTYSDVNPPPPARLYRAIPHP